MHVTCFALKIPLSVFTAKKNGITVIDNIKAIKRYH